MSRWSPVAGLITWLLVSLGVFIAGSVSAMRYAVPNNGYPNEALLRVDWPVLVGCALAAALPAGIIRAAVGMRLRLWLVLVAAIAAVMVIAAIGPAFVNIGTPGPGEPGVNV
jgi:hypothetical protein